MGLKVFLSYGHDQNTDLVLRFKADLEAAGHTPWLDTAEIEHADDWRRVILDGLKDTDWTLAFLSRHAAARPGNAESQRDLSVSHECIGIVLREQGDLPGALAAYRAGLAIDERLARQAPDNAYVQRDLFISYREVARLSVAAGECAAARTVAAKAESQSGLLVERFPHITQHASDLQGAEVLLRDIANACP